jgi:hypothetical protein
MAILFKKWLVKWTGVRVLIWRWQFALEGSVSKYFPRDFGLCSDHNYFEVNIAKKLTGVNLVMTTCPKGKCEQIKHQVV